MRFGTFHLIGAPSMTPAPRRIADTLDYINLADELGFDHAWVAEHHFSNYGYSVNPLLIIAKAAATARRLRFGQAVLVTPFWHPVRLAEDIALTDILTDGRLEIGLGRGYQPMEFEGFGTTMGDTAGLFREQVELMKRCWSEEDFTHQGAHFQVLRPTTVLPRPLQSPHPPIWLACQSMSTLDWTADQGYDVLMSASTNSWDDMASYPPRYQARRTAAGHAGSGRLGVLRFVYCTENEAEARAEVWQTRWQRRLAEHLRKDDQRLKGGVNEAYPCVDEAPDDVWWDRLVYGTPERCIAQIKRDQANGFTELVGWFDIGGLDAETVQRSMRLFAREVLPAVREVAVAR